jgi:hypothetical protein
VNSHRVLLFIIIIVIIIIILVIFSSQPVIFFNFFLIFYCCIHFDFELIIGFDSHIISLSQSLETLWYQVDI